MAIDTPDVPEASISEDPLSIPAGDGATIVEAGADVQVDRSCVSGRRDDCRRREAES